MKKALLSLMLGGMLLATPKAWAQTEEPAPVEYSERVPVDGAGRTALYTRALDWAQNKFTYTPKSGLNAVEAAGTIRVTGTGTVKQVDNRGKDETLTVLFTFSFQATDNSYSYQVSSFQIIPDPKEPSQTMELDAYRTQLRADKNNDKTHNDRRITAQANSLASEAAMSFRSYMNSQPAEGNIGLVEN